MPVAEMTIGEFVASARKWVYSLYCWRCRRELNGRGYCRDHPL